MAEVAHSVLLSRSLLFLIAEAPHQLLPVCSAWREMNRLSYAMKYMINDKQ
jgi:hypothetical protein